MERSRSWYEAGLPIWTRAPSTDLNDLPRLTETVTRLIDARLEGPEFDQTVLVRDLSAFVHALGSRNPAEYLKRSNRFRHMAHDFYEDRALHASYRVFSGEPLPATMEATELFNIFWKGDSDAISHPRSLAGIAAIQVARSKLRPSESSDSKTSILAQVYPSFPLFQSEDQSTWIGPTVQGLPAVTRPTTGLSQVIEKHKHTLMTLAFLALRNADGEIVPINILLFFSPDEEVWHFEGFGNYYSSYVFWPV